LAPTSHVYVGGQIAVDLTNIHACVSDW